MKLSNLNETKYNFVHSIFNKLARSQNFVQKLLILSSIVNYCISITKYLCYQHRVT